MMTPEQKKSSEERTLECLSNQTGREIDKSAEDSKSNGERNEKNNILELLEAGESTELLKLIKIEKIDKFKTSHTSPNGIRKVWSALHYYPESYTVTVRYDVEITFSVREDGTKFLLTRSLAVHVKGVSFSDILDNNVPYGSGTVGDAHYTIKNLETNDMFRLSPKNLGNVYDQIIAENSSLASGEYRKVDNYNPDDSWG